MSLPYPLLISLRYSRAGRGNQFISFMGLSSMLGVALGVAALVTVISVMNGYEVELRSRILGVVSHVTVSGWDGRLDDWQARRERLMEVEEVNAGAPFIELQGMLSANGRTSGAMIRGIEPALEATVSEFPSYMQNLPLSALAETPFGVVLGVELANTLGVLPGEKVTLMLPKLGISPVGAVPRMKRFTVIDVFQAGMREYDSSIALVNLGDAARLARLDDQVQGLRLSVVEPLRAPAVTQRIATEYPDLAVTDWTRQHRNFFRAVRTEKTMMFLILTLIVAVAAFNIVSALVMLVTDKQSDIAILRTMGARPRGILALFVLQGATIGVIGTLIGTGAGIALATNLDVVVPWIESLLGFDVFPADVYYIADLPSELRSSDVLTIVGVSLSLCLLATLYPAWRGARLDPAQALRHE
ncbi:MAG: lipoprotein-releasing ABC transporter permease subunit [Immundisolibacteraceae bacterium]|nr:lipoprotein-releasing ABC transporter permease subunit [Immundisolibacteraceae bacterium]